MQGSASNRTAPLPNAMQPYVEDHHLSQVMKTAAHTSRMAQAKAAASLFSSSITLLKIVAADIRSAPENSRLTVMAKIVSKTSIRDTLSKR